MRRNGMTAIVLLLLLSGLGRAGVYSTIEPPVGPRLGKEGVAPLPFGEFEIEMSGVRLPVQEANYVRLIIPNAAGAAGQGLAPLGSLPSLIAMQANPALPSSLQNYWRLAAQEKSSDLIPADQVNLSYYLIYLGRTDDAIALLRKLASNRQTNNFMVSANLAAAYLTSGNLRSALDATDDSLYFLKRGWPGWSREQVAWVRRMEEIQKKLIRLRLREASQPSAGQSKLPKSVDDLFDVKFTAEDGIYEAGRIAEGQKAKLPKDALAVSQQLALSYPNDTRLFWLVGEVLNAEGRADEAKKILDQCSDSRAWNGVAELRRHRQILAEALQKSDEPVSALPGSRKLIAVGIGAGLFVAFLLYWQLRELRRRRLAKS